MANRVDLEEIFFDFFESAKEFVPEADYSEMCASIFRNLEDKGYDIQLFLGHDEIIDEAIYMLHPELEEDVEEYE